MNPEAAALLDRMCSAEVTAVACRYREEDPRWGSVVADVVHAAPDRWAVADARGPLWWSDGARALFRVEDGGLRRVDAAAVVLETLQSCLRPAGFGICSDLRRLRESEALVEADVRRGSWWWGGREPPPRTPEEYRRRALARLTPNADRAPEAVVHDGRAAHQLVLETDRDALRLVVDDQTAIVLAVRRGEYTAELTDVRLAPVISEVMFQLGDAW